MHKKLRGRASAAVRGNKE